MPLILTLKVFGGYSDRRIGIQGNFAFTASPNPSLVNRTQIRSSTTSHKERQLPPSRSESLFHLLSGWTEDYALFPKNYAIGLYSFNLESLLNLIPIQFLSAFA
jgi:hypothetical protein